MQFTEESFRILQELPLAADLQLVRIIGEIVERIVELAEAAGPLSDFGQDAIAPAS